MKKKKTRRQFMTGAAAAVGGALLVEPTVQAQEEPKSALASTARGLTEIVRARHGQHLTEDQLKNIQQALARSLAGAEALKRTPLENGDEPAFAFSAEDGK